MRLAFDPAVRRTDGGRTLIGGFPLRILRLSGAGQRWLDRVAGGGDVPAGDPSATLARRLVDAGIASPIPEPGTGPTVDDVAVVIPVKDDERGLAATLRSLGEVGHVVVVDDGSANPIGSGGDSLRVPAKICRQNESVGPGAARELGWRGVDAPVLAFVDANVVPDDGWLAVLLPHLADPEVGAVAPRVRSSAGDAPGWLAQYESFRSSLDLGPVPAPVRPGSRVPYVPTAALVVRRRALEAIGGFSTEMRVGEDVDLVWRLHQAGWRVRYEPAATVRHPSRPTLGAWLRQGFTYGTSAAALHARHDGAVAALNGVSGWSALAWAAVLVGHPLVGVAIGAGTTVALVPKLRSLDHPGREAIRLAGAGNLWAGRRVADALRRSWWPPALVLGATYPPSRLALVATVVVPTILERREVPMRFVALRLLDDVAYGAGVWVGCWRARSIGALLPSFTGPLPPPTE